MSFEDPKQCVICAARCAVEWSNEKLTVFKCGGCGHRIARHAASPDQSLDYHKQYDQAGFVDSLELTRRRQAFRILGTMRSSAGAVDIAPWLDFGCGRGWFLDVLKNNEVAPLAGADTSELSREWLKQNGVRTFGIQVKNDEISLSDDAIEFHPRCISFLDVVEHFTPASLRDNVRQLLNQLGSLQWVVIKVPVSDGVLFRLANMARRFGSPRLLEQLYQAGTYPPHSHYFSRASLRQFTKQIGCNIVCVLDDVDFDGLINRIQFLKGVPDYVQRPIDRAVSAVCSLLGADSRIVFARASRSGNTK